MCVFYQYLAKRLNSKLRLLCLSDCDEIH